MIIAQTPLRLSFVGGGSDMRAFYEKKDGAVVCTAIDKYVYAIVKERFDEDIYLNYSEKERVKDVKDIRHDLVREAMRITGVTAGVEITTLADIPSSGSGLGSSSAITVALLHALHTHQNNLVTAEQLAEEACHIEIDLLNKPIGRQDQYAAAYGGMHRFTFRKNEEVLRQRIRLSPALSRRISENMQLFFTGITRSADTILSEQQQNLSQQDKFDTLAAMVALVSPFSEALTLGDMETCGGLLHKNWILKQSLASGISSDSTRAMYEAARNCGASGGKIAGAGGGGFMFFFTPPAHQAAVRAALEQFREFPFLFSESGSRIIFDGRSYSAK
ncbi:D-glycero-alpha-D-manno-heptose-7-phosphate kinase [Desulfobotulus alkaliphilus]|uniref:D-glycero-alpha-D-manno-heptose-7-phosphate kinase n=1 Tax=Desulfobotulus alkaliphilus TaxID=622671 RepID=A0A562S777_9BACT|nr:GHMP kinase [Desulfobotulus alkaliphilus]TWI77261.1 D-glycero-alpha-D-manno-heptose-7-phosphate kinase [Desulfobotulus alkaliphilus]